ncbi:MAG: hydrolase TatD [Bacteroidetes bacterium HGW-Bacteroidetes-7]|jgi:TatD DNase family protein|nr:MAG: hydrolase TatD [Bacteroidetes bacterium HGW-Bacteroidetes-7]
MLKYIDTHSHLYDSDFENDINEVTERSKSNGVFKIVMPAVDSTTHAAMMTLAGNLPGFAFPATGLHPTSVKDNWREELDFVIDSAQKHNYIAIGEIGLDGYWSKEFMSEQITVFEEQLRLASSKNLPVIIHSREATEEIFNSLDRCRGLNLKGVFHAFSGSYETACRIFTYGDFKLGIGGVITFKNSNLPKVIEKIGLDKILLETDSPWLSPAPYRGKRNEPSYLTLVSEKIAQIKGCSIDQVAQITTINAGEIFNF